MQSEPPFQTLLSSLEIFQKHDVFPQHAVHPFATAAPESCGLLQDLINTTEQLSHSLQTYESSTQWTNPKLVSLMRQHTAIEHATQSSTKNIQHLIDVLSQRSGVSYGENIPLLATSFPQWCVDQLAAWGTSVGMETFKDESREGCWTVVLGGKILVIDKYCTEMQKDEDSRDPQYAASLRKDMLNHLRYLVLLDGLASRKDDGGIRWFTDIDELCPMLNGLPKVKQKLSLDLSTAPLDIFLLRSHSLPLPYLISPSVSFLIYLSPLSYLSLSHKAKDFTLKDSPFEGLSFSDIKSYLRSLPKAHLYPPSMSMPNITARPTFPLVASASDLDHSFPQLDSFGMDANSSAPFAWVLDFTAGGKLPGVIMSQSRMKAIELVVNPLGGGDGWAVWVDHLLNPGNAASPERYTTLYRSPGSLHPPLQLRLTAPEEPGFTLERIPVHSIKEVWGILEVVREQCWLNEILLGSHWTPEGLKSEEEDVQPDDSIATEDELQAVLTGTFVPRKIPVNVFLPTGNATDTLFGPSDLDFSPASGPKIVMTSPERTPISGLVEITVTHDETKPRGVSVEIQGAMGCDLEPADLELICRRGGTLGLPGRVWASIQKSNA
ncbi:hypothetical protein BDZ97DRAFT_1787474 [Flammula alnicola]|nr:hypothetical protein BDZ97DRAFT_1787474 [Flammula alnicola]